METAELIELVSGTDYRGSPLQNFKEIRASPKNKSRESCSKLWTLPIFLRFTRGTSVGRGKFITLSASQLFTTRWAWSRVSCGFLRQLRL